MQCNSDRSFILVLTRFSRVRLDGSTQVHKRSAYSVELINKIKNYVDTFSINSHTVLEISNETGPGEIGT